MIFVYAKVYMIKLLHEAKSTFVVVKNVDFKQNGQN